MSHHHHPVGQGGPLIKCLLVKMSFSPLSVKRDSVIARTYHPYITSIHFFATKISLPLSPLLPKTIQFFLRDTYIIHTPILLFFFFLQCAEY